MGEGGGQKSGRKFGHHLWMVPSLIKRLAVFLVQVLPLQSDPIHFDSVHLLEVSYSISETVSKYVQNIFYYVN